MDTRFELNCLPAWTEHQRVGDESFAIRGGQFGPQRLEPATATRFTPIIAKRRRLSVQTRADVTLMPIALADIVADQIITSRSSAATDEARRYLAASFLCPVEELRAFAQAEFACYLNPLSRARAIERWVRQMLEPIDELRGALALPDARACLKAREADSHGRAHVLIALSRACGLPARHVTSIATGHQPTGIHAFAEVLIGDTWVIADPDDRLPHTALVRIGTGRDASDVPLWSASQPSRLLEVHTSIDTRRLDIPALGRYEAQSAAISISRSGGLARASRLAADLLGTDVPITPAGLTGLKHKSASGRGAKDTKAPRLERDFRRMSCPATRRESPASGRSRSPR